jgi:hypothetical protein
MDAIGWQPPPWVLDDLTRPLDVRHADVRQADATPRCDWGERPMPTDKSVRYVTGCPGCEVGRSVDRRILPVETLFITIQESKHGESVTVHAPAYLRWLDAWMDDGGLEASDA